VLKSIGYLLLAGGFLAAAYSTALDTQAIDWSLFVPMAILAIAGVWIIKNQSRGEARSEQVLTASRTELRESLGNVIRDLGQIIGNAESITTIELRNAIDARLRNDLRRFAEARESLVHLYGLQAYADIMSDFATGERYVNRVWSAAADDYRAEASAYLHKALARFTSAMEQLEAAARPATS
jgi:hypothetical protein